MDGITAWSVDRRLNARLPAWLISPPVAAKKVSACATHVGASWRFPVASTSAPIHCAVLRRLARRARGRRRYIQPGKPDQNTDIKRFNRTYRTEVLTAHFFESIAALQTLTRQCVRTYNYERPTTASGDRRPHVPAEAHDRQPVSFRGDRRVDGEPYARAGKGAARVGRLFLTSIG
jgi:hypothetical protein